MPAPRWLSSGAIGSSAKFLPDAIGALKALERRIEQAGETNRKNRRHRYISVWADGKIYYEGQFCTHDNSMWHCNVDGAEQQPGTRPLNRFGRDAVATARTPTRAGMAGRTADVWGLTCQPAIPFAGQMSLGLREDDITRADIRTWAHAHRPEVWRVRARDMRSHGVSPHEIEASIEMQTEMAREWKAQVLDGG